MFKNTARNCTHKPYTKGYERTHELTHTKHLFNLISLIRSEEGKEFIKQQLSRYYHTMVGLCIYLLFMCEYFAWLQQMMFSSARDCIYRQNCKCLKTACTLCCCVHGKNNGALTKVWIIYTCEMICTWIAHHAAVKTKVLHSIIIFIFILRQDVCMFVGRF